nr:hypothetical protein [Tanacetum cinerariifolium]
MTVGLAVCKNYLNDDIIYTTLKDGNLDQHETCRRLKMIRDVRENETCRRLKMIHDVRDHEVASKYSVDDVYTLLKECNMDPSKATQRLSYIDVKSSTSDPKAASYQNTNYTCYVGTIMCHKVAPKLSSDVKSSTSDPKAASYQNTNYTCYVDTCIFFKHHRCSSTVDGENVVTISKVIIPNST